MIARTKTSDPDERERLWSLTTSIYPKYGEYQFGRAIPLIIVEPTA